MFALKSATTSIILLVVYFGAFFNKVFLAVKCQVEIVKSPVVLQDYLIKFHIRNDQVVVEDPNLHAANIVLQVLKPFNFQNIAIELLLLLVGQPVHYGVDAIVYVGPISIYEKLEDVVHALQLVLYFLELRDSFFHFVGS